MLRFFRLFTTVCLFLWLLPLGAFIKPCQEKVACDGHRAFHMCSMMTGKVRPGTSSKISFSNGTGAERTAKSSAAGGDDFLPVETPQNLVQKSRYFPFIDFISIRQPHVQPFVPPPEVTLF